MKTLWVHEYGQNNEWWHCNEFYDTKEEAITAGRQEAREQDESHFEVGEYEPVYPNPPDTEKILEWALDQFYDEVADLAEYWCPSSEQVDDLQDELNKLWESWLTKHNLKDLCFKLTNVTLHETGEPK